MLYRLFSPPDYHGFAGQRGCCKHSPSTQAILWSLPSCLARFPHSWWKLDLQPRPILSPIQLSAVYPASRVGLRPPSQGSIFRLLISPWREIFAPTSVALLAVEASPLADSSLRQLLSTFERNHDHSARSNNRHQLQRSARANGGQPPYSWGFGQSSLPAGFRSLQMGS